MSTPRPSQIYPLAADTPTPIRFFPPFCPSSHSAVDSAPHSAGRSSQGRQVGRTIPATRTSSRPARCGRVPTIRHHTAVRFVREPHASMWHVLGRRVLGFGRQSHNQEPSSAAGREHFKRPDDAEKMFQRAMALSPDSTDAKFYYAALREQAADRCTTDCRRTSAPSVAKVVPL